MAPLARIQCTAALVSSPPENAMPTFSPFGSFPRMFTGGMISDQATSARIRRVRAFATFIAVVSFTQAFAAPFAVQVGDTKLVLDTPPGFADVQATGSPRLLELAEQLTAASNRILVFALEDGDVRRFNVGDSPELRRYVIAVTPRELQSTRVTPSAFQSLVA